MNGAQIHAFTQLLQRHRAGAVDTRQAVVATDGAMVSPSGGLTMLPQTATRTPGIPRAS